MLKVSCGLYGVAEKLEQDFWGTMQALADSGFTAVEPLVAFKNDPALLPDSPVPTRLKTILWNIEKIREFQPRLRAMGLEISSMHAGFLFTNDLEAAAHELVEIAKETGIRTFVTSLTFDSEKSCEEAAELMLTVQRILKPHGVELLYHNHEMEFGRMDNGEQTLLEYFLKLTKGEVRLQVDTGWVLYGGENPVVFLEKHKDLIASIHLKDICKAFHSAARDDIFVPTGTGALQTDRIMTLAKTMNLIPYGVMIDQDGAKPREDILENLRYGMNYLNESEKTQLKIQPKLSLFLPNLLELANQEQITIEEALQWIKSQGINAVYVDYPGIREDTDMWTKLLAQSELKISGLFDFYDFAQNPTDDRFQETVDFAQKQGIGHILIVPGNVRDGAEREQDLLRIVEAMKRICAYAAPRHVQIEMEDSDGNLPYCSDEEMLWFLSRIPGLQLCFDTGNFIYKDTDVTQAYKMLESYITNIHMKDRALDGKTPNSVKENGEKLYCAAIGKGILPLAEIVRMLCQRGYNDYYNIELFGAEHMKEAIKDSAEWLKQEVQKYANL